MQKGGIVKHSDTLICKSAYCSLNYAENIAQDGYVVDVIFMLHNEQA